MKSEHRYIRWFVTVVMVLVASRAAGGASVNSTLDASGKRTTSASYTMDGSVGGIGGISIAPGDTARHGYIGQLAEVVSVRVTSAPNTLNENATGQLSGTAALDDSSVSVLFGSDIAWASAIYPLASIDGNGFATASTVYATTNATFNGFYLGVSGTGLVAVIDSDPDNYGSYAGDGLPDWWQIQYFGFNNPNAAPTLDLYGTGQNNLFKYVAGLDPTNPASIFVLKIASVTGQPNQKNLIFYPIAGGRTYTVQFRTDLVSGAYANLTGFSGPQTNISEVTVTDLDATMPTRFYRIDINLP
jgi:hypothetical protein